MGLLKSNETSNSSLLIRVLKEANGVDSGVESREGIFALFDCIAVVAKDDFW